MNHFQTAHKTALRNVWLKFMFSAGCRVREAMQSFVSECEGVSILLARFTTLQHMILYDRKQKHAWLIRLYNILASPECSFCPIDFWCGSWKSHLSVTQNECPVTSVWRKWNTVNLISSGRVILWSQWKGFCKEKQSLKIFLLGRSFSSSTNQRWHPRVSPTGWLCSSSNK